MCPSSRSVDVEYKFQIIQVGSQGGGFTRRTCLYFAPSCLFVGLNKCSKLISEDIFLFSGTVSMRDGGSFSAQNKVSAQNGKKINTDPALSMN